LTRRVAFVVQRYGPDVTGGSESLARAVAERLAATHEVTVFTSCARDYVTWRNEYPEGETTENGVKVRRFRVTEERDLAAFNAFAEPLYLRAASDAEEQEFLRRQGPHVPALVEALTAVKDRFDAVLFFTYLYYPTWAGLRAAPERAILVPTTHDEPPLRFRLYRDVFALPRAFAFLTPPEEALVRSRFELGARPAVVAGIGIDAIPAPDVEGFRIRRRVDRPYAIYAGRIDAGKGCEEMLAFFEAYRGDHVGGLDLLLIGNLAMPAPATPGVRYLGYLDEAEKAAALAGARAVVCPSPYESLSIVLLEGLAQGVPALATARSSVLVDHCRRSNGGLWYDGPAEFSEALDLLARDDGLRMRLGDQGRAYVAASYSWEQVLARYRSLIDAVTPRRG
jgi:glycosyltransferase involved in cell wall biosynthesis